MNLEKIFITFILVLFTGTALAQTTYKCGSPAGHEEGVELVFAVDTDLDSVDFKFLMNGQAEKSGLYSGNMVDFTDSTASIQVGFGTGTYMRYTLLLKQKVVVVDQLYYGQEVSIDSMGARVLPG